VRHAEFTVFLYRRIQKQNGFSGNKSTLQFGAEKSYLTVLEFRGIFLEVSLNLHLKYGFENSAELGPGKLCRA
jgi:hypothetical protein